MENTDPAWHAVTGFGGHIKASSTTLTIEQQRNVQEIPLDSVGHLLIIGGHTIHTAAITHLLRSGVPISFFDADGRPTGRMLPYGFEIDQTNKEQQAEAPRHTLATEIVRSALKSRLMAVEEAGTESGTDLFYEGEYEILHQTLTDLEYLVTMDELRRIHQQNTAMYYEILSRITDPTLGYRRRTQRPHQDPVNAMLSIGYSILYGAVNRAVRGAFFDPDIGLLTDGNGALIRDLMEPLKARMIDQTVFAFARTTDLHGLYTVNQKRCHLKDSLINDLVVHLKKTINQQEIDQITNMYRRSLSGEEPFAIHYW